VRLGPQGRTGKHTNQKNRQNPSYRHGAPVPFKMGCSSWRKPTREGGWSAR
jgi:hypothetical protein